MPKKIMRRKSSDNPYLHKDFHIALNYSIDYLHNNMGREAVKEYFTQFANAYYSPIPNPTRIVIIALLYLPHSYD